MSNTLMAGKRGLIMGLANDKSIAWGIARACAEAGAELAFSYQGDALKKRVAPLAEQLGSNVVLPCDVSDMDSVDALFAELEKTWGKIDFLVHAIGFSDKTELRGRYVDTTRTNFLVLEMGMRGRQHIAYLCRIAHPRIAGVINVGSAFVNMSVLSACIETGAAYIDTAIHEDPLSVGWAGLFIGTSQPDLGHLSSFGISPAPVSTMSIGMSWGCG